MNLSNNQLWDLLARILEKTGPVTLNNDDFQISALDRLTIVVDHKQPEQQIEISVKPVKRDD